MEAPLCQCAAVAAQLLFRVALLLVAVREGRLARCGSVAGGVVLSGGGCAGGVRRLESRAISAAGACSLPSRCRGGR